MNSVTVKEWVAGPGSYQDKVLTFAELRETFGPGDLVTALMDEVERLGKVVDAVKDDHYAMQHDHAKIATENARLREALTQAQCELCADEFDRQGLADYLRGVLWPVPSPGSAP